MLRVVLVKMDIATHNTSAYCTFLLNVKVYLDRKSNLLKSKITFWYIYSRNLNIHWIIVFQKNKKNVKCIRESRCRWMFKTILCHQRFVIELYYLHIISVEWVILVQLTIKRKRVFSCTVNVHSSLLLLVFFSCLGKDLHFISEICNLTVVFFMSAEAKLTKK